MCAPEKDYTEAWLRVLKQIYHRLDRQILNQDRIRVLRQIDSEEKEFLNYLWGLHNAQ